MAGIYLHVHWNTCSVGQVHRAVMVLEEFRGAEGIGSFIHV